MESLFSKGSPQKQQEKSSLPPPGKGESAVSDNSPLSPLKDEAPAPATAPPFPLPGGLVGSIFLSPS